VAKKKGSKFNLPSATNAKAKPFPGAAPSFAAKAAVKKAVFGKRPGGKGVR
jgi:hypothetical protein